MNRYCRTVLITALSLLVARGVVAQSADEREEERKEREQERKEREQERAERDREKQDRDRERFDRDYQIGTKALDDRQWEKAVGAFGQVADKKGPRADGAFYWKAYAQVKLGRSADSLATLAALRTTYANSRWLNDAKALEAEVKQANGLKTPPEKESDEDLKLFAINSLMNSNQERAVPLLEQILQGRNTPKMKERALFVLAQSDSARGREIIAQIAKGGSNPDLQLKAVEYLGVFGGRENRQILSEVYKSTADFSIRRSILHSYMVAGAREQLLAAAKSEPNPDLRREAIHMLGASGGHAELFQLYGTETSPEVKEALINALFISGDSEKMAHLARSEKDLKLRCSAIQKLGLMGGPADVLVSLYQSDSNATVRRTVLDGLFVGGHAKQLVEIARKETDPRLKKMAVEKLSLMDSKEAIDFLMELLNK